MTREDITRWAQEAAVYADAQTMDRFEWHGIRDEHFARLVAAHEREQCAAICDAVADEEVGDAYRASAESAARIRARGSAE